MNPILLFRKELATKYELRFADKYLSIELNVGQSAAPADNDLDELYGNLRAFLSV